MVVDEDEETEVSKTSVSKDLIVYSAEKLMQLKIAPLSQKWPPYLDEAFKNNRGTWDPDRWHHNKKRGSTPPPSEDKTSEKGGGKHDYAGNDSGLNRVCAIIILVCSETFQVLTSNISLIVRCLSETLSFPFFVHFKTTKFVIFETFKELTNQTS